MQRSDIEQLRRAGWNDESIHLATQIIGYFNYINRVADGLQVDEESWMGLPPELSRDEWLKSKATPGLPGADEMTGNR